MLVTLYEVLRNYAKQTAANFHLHCSLKCVRHERWTAGDYSVPSVDYNLGHLWFLCTLFSKNYNVKDIHQELIDSKVK